MSEQTKWFCPRCHASGEVVLGMLDGMNAEGSVATILDRAHRAKSPDCVPIEGLRCLVPVVRHKLERRTVGWTA